jgi:hypothetical protein
MPSTAFTVFAWNSTDYTDRIAAFYAGQGELIRVTAGMGSDSWTTMARGQEGTTAVTFASGKVVTFTQGITAAMLAALPTINGTKIYERFTAVLSQPPTSNQAVLDTRNSTTPTSLLDFDDSTKWAVTWIGFMPDTAILTSGLKVYIFWTGITAITGTVKWQVEFERCNTTLDSDSFDTAVTAVDAAPGTVGVLVKTTITVTTIDGITAGDMFRLRLTRVADDATNDTMLGNAQVPLVVVGSAA